MEMWELCLCCNLIATSILVQKGQGEVLMWQCGDSQDSKDR